MLSACETLYLHAANMHATCLLKRVPVRGVLQLQAITATQAYMVLQLKNNFLESIRRHISGELSSEGGSQPALDCSMHGFSA